MEMTVFLWFSSFPFCTPCHVNVLGCYNYRRISLCQQLIEEGNFQFKTQRNTDVAIAFPQRHGAKTKMLTIVSGWDCGTKCRSLGNVPSYQPVFDEKRLNPPQQQPLRVDDSDICPERQLKRLKLLFSCCTRNFARHKLNFFTMPFQLSSNLATAAQHDMSFACP
jgi:hypothetical protein